MDDRRRCTATKADGTRCGAPPVTGTERCAGHSPDCQRKARQRQQEKRRSLETLPGLTDAESAERFLARVAELVAHGQVKTELARELRLLAKDFATVHQGRLASQEFEALKAKVNELAGVTEPWR